MCISIQVMEFTNPIIIEHLTSYISIGCIYTSTLMKSSPIWQIQIKILQVKNCKAKTHVRELKEKYV